jgi:outer membrane protein assembly factor BamB
VRVFHLNGNELRRIPIAAPCESGAVALSDGLVVLGDVYGGLYAIDPVGGVIKWKHALSSVLLGQPVRIGEDVLVQTADNRIYRFGPDGAKRWSYTGNLGGLSLHQGAAPVVAGDTIYAVFANGDAVALKADSGNLIWRRQLILDSSAAVLSELKTPVADPVLAGDMLIVSIYQDNLLALSTKTGEQIWLRALSVKSTPLLDHGILYVATSKGEVLAIEPENGQSLWRQKLGGGELVGPVQWQDQLAVADESGHVYLLRKDGELAGYKDMGGRFDRPPVVTARGLLVRKGSGSLHLIH